MSHLRIQILGPLAVWEADDDGVWEPIKISMGKSTALLAALIFSHGPISRQQLAEDLWEQEPVEAEPRRYQDALKKAIWRLRDQLGSYRDILPDEPSALLTGRRASDDAPQRVRIDWDDIKQLQKDNEHEQVLKLVRGPPLPESTPSDGDLGPLVDRIRAEVSSVVERSLAALKLPVPDPLLLGRHLPPDFSRELPPDWRPRLRGRDAQPVSAEGDRQVVRRPPSLFGALSAAQLLQSCYEGEARLGRELDEMQREGAHLWWSLGSHQWLGHFFASWYKLLPTPCEEIAITYVDDRYDSARLGLEPPRDAPKDKAVILEASSLLGDKPDKHLVCGTTNWGVAHTWAKTNAEQLFEHPLNLSVFGIRGRPAYPGIGAVHTLAQTRDGYILLALRSPHVDFYRQTWSASFEEGLSVGAREFTGPMSGDETLLDAVEGALYEEWGIEEDAVRDTTCLAIGREWVRERIDGASVLNLSTVVLAGCRLKLSLDEIWESLDAVGAIRDRDEHGSWAGCRFAERDDVLRFVAASKDRAGEIGLADLCAQPDIKVELKFYPRGATENVKDRGFMPTSQARLILASAWLSTFDPIT